MEWWSAIVVWFKDLIGLSGHLRTLRSQVAQARKDGVDVFESMCHLAQLTIDDSKRERKFIRQHFSRFGVAMKTSIDREAREGNPLLAEEVERLRSYYERAQAGQPFSAQAARDFSELARRLERDREGKGELDWGAIALAALAGFILAKLLSD